MQRGFAVAYLLFGVLVLAALGGAYFFGKSQVFKPQVQNQVVSQAPQPVISTKPTSPSDETANWKTYTNEKYNWEMQYPSDWDVKSFGKLANNTLDFVAFNPGKVEDEFSSINVVVSNKTYETELELLPVTNEPVKINNLVGVKSTETEPGGSEYITVIFKASSGYPIKITGKKEVERIFNQILSTFKFSDSNQTTDTANWKSYKSSAYRFEFKYPLQAELSSGSQALDSETLLSQSINFQKENSFEAGVIDVTVSLIPFNENVKVWEGVAKTSSVSTLVNGVQAKKLEWVESERSDGKDLYNQKILFSKGSYTYLLSAYVYNNSNNKAPFMKVFNQILSTFRFD